MYEFHGWLGLAESTEEADCGNLEAAISELRDRVQALGWQTANAEVLLLNGQFFLRLTGLVNRRRDEARNVAELLTFVSNRLPGSWGMVYERSDDMPTPPGPGAFRVLVLSRGVVREHLDPFLSPVNPNIED